MNGHTLMLAALIRHVWVESGRPAVLAPWLVHTSGVVMQRRWALGLSTANWICLCYLAITVSKPPADASATMAQLLLTRRRPNLTFGRSHRLPQLTRHGRICRSVCLGLPVALLSVLLSMAISAGLVVVPLTPGLRWCLLARGACFADGEQGLLHCAATC